jgi:hypothetical protein
VSFWCSLRQELVDSADGLLAVIARPSKPHIALRQTPQVPPACRPQCAEFQLIFDACNQNATVDGVSCEAGCDSTNFASIAACAQCVVNNTSGENSSDMNQIQSELNQIAASCYAKGFNVVAPTLTLPSSQ